MASFIIKHTVGKQLEAAKGAVGGGGDGDDDEKAAEEAKALEEQRREEEEKRKEKHRKMEAERESMRQEIRDKDDPKLSAEQKQYRITAAGMRSKYNIKKKELGMPEPEAEGSLNRKRKSPAELAAEANQEEEESVLPAGLTDLTSKMTDLTGDVTNKCVLQ